MYPSRNAGECDNPLYSHTEILIRLRNVKVRSPHVANSGRLDRRQWSVRSRDLNSPDASLGFQNAASFHCNYICSRVSKLSLVVAFEANQTHYYLYIRGWYWELRGYRYLIKRPGTMEQWHEVLKATLSFRQPGSFGHHTDDSKSPQSLDSLLRPGQLSNPIQSKQMFSLTRVCSGARLGRLCATLVVFGITLMGTLYIGFTIQDSPSSTGISVRSGTHLQNALGNNSEFLINHTATSRFQGKCGGPLQKIEVGPLEFGDVFDVSRLANELGMHILEWREVKNSALDTHLAKGSIQPEVEKIGCWSTWALSSFSNGQPRYSDVPGLYNLDSFTLSGGSKKGQYYLSLWSLASLAYRATREWAYGVQSSRTLPLTSGTGERIAPGEKLLCFDLLYYIGLANEEEWWKDYAPYWPKIGVHLHWTSQLLELAQGYLRRHFKVKDGEPIPPFISVHVRRADFAGWCPSNMSREACFATPDDYAKRVREVQASLRLQSTPIDVRSVLVTSDERDPGWWEEMAEFGPEWGWVDHKAEGTVEKYGKCEIHRYPVVLDAVFQSLGTGFVGTDRSTMSLLSQRRVESWNNGVASLVKWGSPNADAH
ncbi:hypothetical protein AG1IA_01505 [Rhizoctonia solani AG-1 IA]|uniref:GDP-fucose protein O-fucosyltransferase domain-containing protein n=1 Tax=Thanatephorus cucumeris (strain AG1-IA) TaxID=983506 RepID=L8X2C7_THACA|nr:hypothetical protein AG1IA_01505 [Rhizoctonia solani AG-1 IA]